MTSLKGMQCDLMLKHCTTWSYLFVQCQHKSAAFLEIFRYTAGLLRIHCSPQGASVQSLRPMGLGGRLGLRQEQGLFLYYGRKMDTDVWRFTCLVCSGNWDLTIQPSILFRLRRLPNDRYLTMESHCKYSIHCIIL